MKKQLLASAAALAVFAASTSAQAATYIGTRTVDTATVNLSITTDDTIGALTVPNILDFTISVTDPSGNFTMNGPLSGDDSFILISGTALTATATDILFNFDAPDGFALFQLASGVFPFYCPQVTGCYNFGVPGEGIGDPNFPVVQNRTGLVSLASTGGAVPEPATWAFMIFGFGAVGGAMRRKSKVTTKISYA